MDERLNIESKILFCGGYSSGVVSQTLPALDVKSLKQETAFSNETVHVDNVNVPVPTNQWYSSISFASVSEPMFAYPLAIKMETDGFGVSYPSIVSTADTVFGSYDASIRIVFHADASDAAMPLRSVIGDSDGLSVGIVEKYDGNVVSRLRVTHGSPFVFSSIVSGVSVDVVSNAANVIERGNDFVLFSDQGKLFALFFSPETLSVNSATGGALRFSPSGPGGAEFSLAVLPNHESLELFHRHAFNPIMGTRASFSVGDGEVNSRFDLLTRDGGDTLFALLPRHVKTLGVDSNSRLLLENAYSTLRGAQSLYEGQTFSFSRETPKLPEHLSLDALSESDRETLRALVKDDAKRLKLSAQDTYFLGKQLFAMANLLDMAEQLGMRDESDSLKQSLKTELEKWRTNSFSAGAPSSQYFSYDPIVHGIVGKPASFGSDRFNDHHFHYGYFIFAASTLARYDEDFLNKNELFINALVKDIANADRSDTNFPYIRGFDAYEGHSWASGDGLFADGNNQESSSEAVNAWYAVFLWSEVIHHEGLRQTALYLASEESSSALEYWLNIDRRDARFSQFKHAFVSLVWGGKLDFSTWFSDRAEAKLGIQVIPASPASSYLGIDPDRIRENILSEPDLRSPEMFRDSLAFYRSFFDLSGAEQAIRNLRPEDVDEVNSKSFLTAWILTHKNQ